MVALQVLAAVGICHCIGDSCGQRRCALRFLAELLEQNGIRVFSENQIEAALEFLERLEESETGRDS